MPRGPAFVSRPAREITPDKRDSDADLIDKRYRRDSRDEPDSRRRPHERAHDRAQDMLQELVNNVGAEYRRYLYVSLLHQLASQWFRRANLWIAIPLIILNAFLAVVALATLKVSPSANLAVQVVFAALNIFAAVLVSLQRILQWTERSEAHAMATVAYKAMAVQLRNLMDEARECMDQPEAHNADAGVLNSRISLGALRQDAAKLDKQYPLVDERFAEMLMPYIQDMQDKELADGQTLQGYPVTLGIRSHYLNKPVSQSMTWLLGSRRVTPAPIKSALLEVQQLSSSTAGDHQEDNRSTRPSALWKTEPTTVMAMQPAMQPAAAPFVRRAHPTKLTVDPRTVVPPRSRRNEVLVAAWEAFERVHPYPFIHNMSTLGSSGPDVHTLMHGRAALATDDELNDLGWGIQSTELHQDLARQVMERLKTPISTENEQAVLHALVGFIDRRLPTYLPGSSGGDDDDGSRLDERQGVLDAKEVLTSWLGLLASGTPAASLYPPEVLKEDQDSTQPPDRNDSGVRRQASFFRY